LLKANLLKQILQQLAKGTFKYWVFQLGNEEEGDFCKPSMGDFCTLRRKGTANLQNIINKCV